MSNEPKSPGQEDLSRDRALEGVPDAVLLVDRGGSIVFANQHAHNVFAYEAGELVGLPLEVLIPERHRHDHVRHQKDFGADPEVRPMGTGRELHGVRSDGQELSVEVALGPGRGGQYTIAVVRDNSASVAARKDLEASERRFRIAVGHTCDMVQEANFPEDRMTYFGDIDDHFGYEPGAFPRTLSGLADVVHPEDLDAVETAIEQIAASGEWHVRYRVRAGDGTYRHILDQGSVVSFLEDGQPKEAIGAFSDLTEAVESDRLLRRALEDVAALKDRLAEENLYLRHELRQNVEYDDVVGDCAVWRRAMAQVRLVAGTDSTVLLVGETGTGKGLLARLVHSESERSHRPLLKVNCAALPHSLIESELFGHEKGAFSGADRRRKGRFELADKGTIFLDEIAELPIELQSGLLRVLEGGEFERIGSSETRRIDARVIAATNRDLKREVEEGRFRSDLYYRLAVFPIDVPPLRERREDIPLLATYFLAAQDVRRGKSIDKIPKAVMDAFQAYEWPGNVRELENMIERAVVLSAGDTLWFDTSALRAAPGRPGGASRSGAREVDEVSARSSGPPSASLEEVERAHIVAVLESCRWKVKGDGNAAEQLGLNESTLRSRMKRLGIKRP